MKWFLEMNVLMKNSFTIICCVLMMCFLWICQLPASATEFWVWYPALEMIFIRFRDFLVCYDTLRGKLLKITYKSLYLTSGKSMHKYGEQLSMVQVRISVSNWPEVFDFLCALCFSPHLNSYCGIQQQWDKK